MARLIPGLGLSRASKDRSAYLRYGGSTLASPRGTNFSASKNGGGGGMSSSTSKRNRTASISTEELALGDLTAPGSIAASMYANATADHAQNGGPRGGGVEKQQQAQYYQQQLQQEQQLQFQNQSQRNMGGIVMTTEISVQTGQRQ